MMRNRWGVCLSSVFLLAGALASAQAQGPAASKSADKAPTGTKPGTAAKPPAKEPPKGVFTTDPRLQQKLTVRESGVPLDRLLPRLGKELDVVLEPGSEDVGDIRVSVFAEQLPAARTLEALNVMLNLTREQGFFWTRDGKGPRPKYILARSLAARTAWTRTLQENDARVKNNFLRDLAAIRQDAGLRQRGEDPAPMKGLQRGSYLLSSLSDGQLNQLLQDGVLALRPGEVTPDQQRIMTQMGHDFVADIGPKLSANPDRVDPLYKDLNPDQSTVVLELQRNAGNISVEAEIRLGPGKGGRSDRVFPADPQSGASTTGSGNPPRNMGNSGSNGNGNSGNPPGPGTGGTSGSGNPGDTGDETPIQLRPRSWSMADVLSDLAYRSGKPLVSDCYTQAWTPVSNFRPMPLSQIIARLDQLFGISTVRRDGFVILRSKIAAVRQSREVPQRLLDRWLAQVRRDRMVTLDTLSEIAFLSDPQLQELANNREFQAAAPDLNMVAQINRRYLNFYRLLTPSQRAQVGRGGLQLPFERMTRPQQQEFILSVLRRAPHVPVAEYSTSSVGMALDRTAKWVIGWKVGDSSRVTTWHLSLDRDWMSGEPRKIPAGQAEALVGKPAPALKVTGPDGKPTELAAETASLVVYVRPLWVVPYVSKSPDSADLEGLTTLLEQQPDLARRVALVYPFEVRPTIEKLLADHPMKAPVYLDPNGAAARALGPGDLPRILVLSPAGQVTDARAGYRALTSSDWATLLR